MKKILQKKEKIFSIFSKTYERVLLSNIIYVSPTFLFCVYYCHMVKKLTESKPTSLFFYFTIKLLFVPHRKNERWKYKDESIISMYEYNLSA